MNVLTHLGRQSLKNGHMLLLSIQSAQPLGKLVLIEVDFQRFFFSSIALSLSEKSGKAISAGRIPLDFRMKMKRLGSCPEEVLRTNGGHAQSTGA